VLIVLVLPDGKESLERHGLEAIREIGIDSSPAVTSILYFCSNMISEHELTLQVVESYI